MVLSYKSQTFQDALRELDDSYNQGTIKSFEDTKNYLKEKEIDVADWQKAYKKNKEAIAKGDTGAFLSLGDEGSVSRAITDTFTTPYRVAGRFAEQTLGVLDLVDAFTPEPISQGIKSAVEGIEDMLPEEVSEFIDATFDPYHGEGFKGASEDVIGTIGSYIFGGGAGVKGANLALKSAKLAKSPAARSRVSKQLKELDKAQRTKRIKSLRQRDYLATRAAQGVGVAAGTTAIEDPQENIVNMMIELFPGSEEYMGRLSIDPNDSEAEQYLQGFLNNLGLGALFSPFFVANSFRKPVLEGATRATKTGAKELVTEPTAAREAVEEGVEEGAEQGARTSLPNIPSGTSFLIGTPFEGVARSFARNFTATRGTSPEMLGATLKRDAAIKAAFTSANGTALQAIRRMEQIYGKQGSEGFETAKKNLSGFLRGYKDIDSVFQDKELKELAVGMRNDIDNASRNLMGGLRETTKAEAKQIKGKRRLLAAKEKQLSEAKTEAKRTQLRYDIDKLTLELSDLTSGGFKAVIGEGLGVHLTRTYRFFDDTKFNKKIKEGYTKFKDTGQDPDGIFTGALNAIKEMTPNAKSDVEAMEVLDKLIVKEKNPASIFKGFKIHGDILTTAKSTKEKKDLPLDVRRLLGEVDDPFESYTKTMVNLGKLTSETNFIKDIEDIILNDGGIAKGLISIGKATSKADVKLDSLAAQRLNLIFGDKSKSVLRPFEAGSNPGDVYISKEYVDMITDGLDEFKTDSTFMKYFMGYKGATQAAKTVGGVTTHGRNIMGNNILLMANGFNPFSKEVGKGISDVLKELNGKSTREIGDRLARYQELNITGSNVDIGVMKNNLRALSGGNTEKILEKAGKIPQKITKYITDLYQAEDDVYKIAHFEKTLKYLKKSDAYKDLPIERLEELAAQRTRDLMPNYNLVPKAFKSLRATPVSDYLAFPAEMTRVTKNLAKYTLQDLKSGDSELMKQGAKRLAGMTAIGVGIDAAVEGTKNYFGITDEQDEALNNIAKPWEYNKNRFYLSPIYKDKNGHYGVDRFNMGYIDPFSYIKSNVKNVHAILAAGVDDDDTINELLDRKGMAIFENAAGPFLSPSMATEALLKVSDSLGKGEILDATGELLKPLIPATFTTVQRRAAYEISKQKREPYGLAPVKQGLFSVIPGEVDLLAALGLKREFQDITAGTPYALREALQSIKGASADYDKAVTDVSLREGFGLADVFEGRLQSGEDVITNSYFEGQRKRLKGFKELQSLMDDYQALLGDNFLPEVERGAKTTRDISPGDLDLIGSAANNIFVPFEFRETDFTKFGSQAPMNLQNLYKIYDAFNGTRIK